MIRFAVAVTAIEIGLTFLATLCVTLAEAPEPYLSRAELRDLGFEVESLTTEQKNRFGAAFSYDTRATFPGRPGALLVSLRVQTPAVEFDTRRDTEFRLQGDPSRGVTTVVDTNRRGERGYTVRHRSAKELRAELVRLRGGDMLIVRATRPDVPGPVGNSEAAACERVAGMIHAYMVRKLGWR